MGIVQEKKELKIFTFRHSNKYDYFMKQTLKDGIVILGAGVDEVILDQEMIKELLPHLQKFAETGEL